MDRRESLRYIVLGSVASTLALQGCQTENKPAEIPIETDENHFGRTPAEKKLIEELNSEQYFNAHEMETIATLCNLILPPTDTLKGALDAEVPEFIEFMSKDYPPFQIPLRGGLMWLDHESNERNNLEFKSASEAQQKEILDDIAYPDMENSENDSLAVRFFSLMRNLTLTGYYTSKIGIDELDYKGNTPNEWDGVPEDVLIKHGVAYEQEWLAKCIDHSKRGVIAEWDEQGNLIT